MKKFKTPLIILSVIIGINILLTGINILQNGIGGWEGSTIDQIMGNTSEKVTVKDIEALSKSEMMQLFYSATAPDFADMKGEYKAKTLRVGIMAPAADFYTHHFFGSGHWEGKAFFPFQKDKGWGYNLFSVMDKDGKPSVVRERKMDTFIGKSEIDDKNSFHLVYKSYNGGMVSSMHDEIRKVNDTLYICMGYMAAGGGAINPAPFVLYGKPSKWIGPDKE